MAGLSTVNRCAARICMLSSCYQHNSQIHATALKNCRSVASKALVSRNGRTSSAGFLSEHAFTGMRSSLSVKYQHSQSGSSKSQTAAGDGGKETIEGLQHISQPHSSEQQQESGTLFNGMQPNFPCLLKNPSSGPEPEYDKVVSGYQTFRHARPFYLKYNRCVLPEVNVAYETWGQLNADRSNAILLSSGLSASSHAKSHSENEKFGWWEKFIGPGCALDTDKYYIICANTLGGCYGSSGPSSINSETGAPYGTTFPLVSVFDMVNAQFLLLDHLGIDKLYAAVGSSLGGMCSLSAAVQFPDRVSRMIAISSCASSHPSSIAVRYLQRKAIMTDPNWQQGHYYGKTYPRNGMKMARELGTMTYRSGPEWNERFARKRIDENEEPALCPTFLIESYLDYQGEMFCTMYDPNSLLYISKAMDLFDISEDYSDMTEALSRVQCSMMVLGVTTDLLFPIWQQRELSTAARAAGNSRVTFYELDAIYGHDTFLLDLNGVGSAVKGFLDTQQAVTGRVRPRKDSTW